MAWGRRALGALGVVVIGSLVVTPMAGAADGDHGRGGPSTPSSVVVAVDPPGASDDLKLNVTGHTSRDAVPSATLVLGVDGLVVTDFAVHRIAVGDTSCAGLEDSAPEADEHDGVRAVVRGVGRLAVGNDVLVEGAAVQVWIDLKDLGRKAGTDEGRVRIRPAPHGGGVTVVAHEDGCSGGAGGWTVDTGWRSVLQVHTHQRKD